MRGLRSCRQKSLPRFEMIRHVQRFALLFAERRFSYAFGARCCAFHQATSRLTGASPKQLANRRLLARSEARSAPIRSHLSSRVIALFAKPARSETIIG